ncbi:hypothetical protein DSO57_1032984 [Entomophthora muscae]|uniref:Uncharacterized protein n=1 Tax=Entomophthora muscae TaxID=34485 RepID=A0ACC2TYU8_9FUNG|nr:hypothetical protein DSO57_1032984 [Entomophthora muscae]
MLSLHTSPATPSPCNSTAGNSDSDSSFSPTNCLKDEDTAWNPFSAFPDSDPPIWKTPQTSQQVDTSFDQSTSEILESLHKLRLDTAMARERGLVHPFKRRDEEKKGKNITLFKTEMCTSFNAIGHCRYGNKCKFAHGPEEIRTIARHPKYKTQLCRSFFEGRDCPYGKRCCYLHHSPSDYIGYTIPELSPLIPDPVHRFPILSYSSKALPFQPVNFNSARR